MNSRERFLACLRFQPFDRLPLLEWAMWWDKTIQRWHAEGLPAGLTDRYEITRHFGLDLHYQDWLRACTPECPEPAFHGAPIIRDAKHYEEIRPLLFPREAVDQRRWESWAMAQERGEAILWFTLEGFFWLPRTLLGIENHLYAFYDEPELMHRINRDLADWMEQVIEGICSVCVPDFMTFAEDMSYNNGPMLSEDLFDEFLLPYYHRIIPILKEKGIFTFIDSDGDVARALPWFERAGLDGILPLERQAGVDLATLREAHPDFLFLGHFDKMVMHRGESAMRAEFERLLPVAAKGGFLISCDHQTPPEVSLADYQLYLTLFREYAEKAGRSFSP